MVVRFYSSVAPETTLSAGITNSTTTIQVGSVTGFPSNTPFTLALDYEGATEELVQVESVALTTLQVVRGVDGTSAASHNAGARVRHVSSARDFADSRNHENSANGVHGLAPGEDLVGTDKVQTLTNKTLVNATGSLEDVTVNNTGTNSLFIVGDGTAGLLDFAFNVRQSPSLPPTFRVNYAGACAVINPVSYDASNSFYRFRATKFTGQDIFAVLSGGSVNTTLSNGANGFSVLASPDDVRRRALEVLSNTASLRAAVHTDGSIDLNTSTPTSIPLDIVLSAGHTANAIRVRNSALVSMFSLTPAGLVTAPSVTTTTGTVTNLTVTGSATLPVSSATSTAVATAASGFSINSVTVAAQRGSNTTINVVFTRTGAPIVADATGNIGDVTAFTVAAAWRPNAVFGTERMTGTFNCAGTSGGTVGLNPSTGQMELLTMNGGSTMATNDVVRVTMSYPSV